MPDGLWAEPYGVVFSGGGALGAWEVGCYRSLLSRFGGRAPAVVTGASAGAINAVGVAAQMQPPQLAELWAGLTNEDVYRLKIGLGDYVRFGFSAVRRLSVSEAVKRFVTSETSIYDTSPLQRTLLRILAGYFQSFAQSPTTAVLSLTNLTRGSKEFFFKLPNGGSVPANAQKGALWTRMDSLDLVVQALMGSTALPILFPPFAGTFFDGGVLMNQPITPALALGEPQGVYSYFVVIPSSNRLGAVGNIAQIGGTLASTWLSLSLVGQIENIKLRNFIRRSSGKPAFRICVIRPPRDITENLGVDLLSFGKNVNAMVSDGEQSCSDRLARFDPANDDTWY